MVSVLSGIAVASAGIGGLWYCKPRNGEVQRIVRAPLLDWLIPTAIVGALAIGIALVISGIAG